MAQEEPNVSRVKSMKTLREVRTLDGAQGLEVTWRDGQRGRFHWLWLRENCKAHFDASTGQRVSNTLALPAEAWAPVEVGMKGQDGQGVSITWADGHASEYCCTWLRDHCFDTRHQRRVEPRLWGSELVSYFPGRVLPTLKYTAVQGRGPGFNDWVTHLRDYGLALIEGVPCEEGRVLEMASLISYARKTHYGETFQVRSEAQPQHLAYTPIALDVHTDLNYRESSPGVQLLHCLASEAEGGESTFVDGFKAAETLRKESPEHFATLCHTPIPFRVQDGVGHHYFKVPVICVGEDGALLEVHFSERTRGPLEVPHWAVPQVLQALAHFNDIVHRPENVVEVKLQAGDLLAFNNRRILHGRKAFDPRTGMRHLEGCYVDFDEYLTCLRKHRITPPGLSIKANISLSAGQNKDDAPYLASA